MKTKVVFTVVTKLTEKNFKVFDSGRKKVSVPVLDGVWVDAWVNPNLDAKVNFKVGDTVMIVADQTKTEDNEYNGQTRKQHTFHFPTVVPIEQAQEGFAAGAPDVDMFGGSPMEVNDEDLPF